MTDLADLSAMEARARLARAEISALEMVESCLARIDARENEVQAWTFLDPDYARQQALHLDEWRTSGRAIGPLHGLPVGIKDIIDVEGMPTENGTPIDRGRKPVQDAAIVTRLRQAGAIIMGKTVTTELAVFHPGKTRNPLDPQRTPGGSSSGSAAAVASGMVPLAIGTQTNGSVIRPASFCGIVGFKPSHGAIPRSGVLAQSPFLDTIGAFARGVEDAALLADALCGYDAADTDTRPCAAPALARIAAEAPPLLPTFAFVPGPVWAAKAEPDTKAAFEELAEVLGERCDRADLPELYAGAWDWLRRIQVAEMAKHYAGYHARGRDQLSPVLRGMIEEGQRVLAVDYLAARDWRTVLNGGLDEVFERYDAILTPAANGEAPLGLEATGDPAFSTLWTFCGTPTVTVPLLVGANGMPIGVQLVGRRGDDARLLRSARWLVHHLAHEMNQ